MFDIYNEDCVDTVAKLKDKSIDVVLTSPFYNTNAKAWKSRTLKNTKVKRSDYPYVRCDKFVDNMSNEDYSKFITSVFNSLYSKLNDNGCILFNISYGSENTECMRLTIANILRNTDFTIADDIIWKKVTALPNCCSKNKLTRIVEHIFVFCKRKSFKTFYCSKDVVSVRANGQKCIKRV